ncbi:HAD-IC family P-type ATPase [Endozoicomonas montiporae]|uniref:HAD-IC family P-type ATPase n=1 Tax=Endozoicomonas montiporae TaxID=1027273 RepID=UPI000B21DDAC|nr:HAD-IC family P-type ATPase [Endozoicomonas montiporae]
MKTSLNDHCLVMGSRHFLEVYEAVNFSAFEDEIVKYEQMGRHLIFISHQKQLIGMIGLRDHLREDVVETLSQLRKLGIKELIMISGDQTCKANRLADELQLDKVFAEATPDSKSVIIEGLKQSGKTVLFVGDGVNDTPALSMADVGIAMCDGTELARQTADVVLLKDSLLSVAETVKLANIAWLRLIAISN